jgi:hypothetical protein
MLNPRILGNLPVPAQANKFPSLIAQGLFNKTVPNIISIDNMVDDLPDGPTILIYRKIQGIFRELLDDPG